MSFRDAPHSEPRQSQPRPKPHIQLIRRLVLKIDVPLLPPLPDLPLLIKLPIILHRIPSRLPLPPLKPPHPLPNNPNHFPPVLLQLQEIRERF